MDKMQVYEMLEENLQELRIVENEISMVQLARYQKRVNKVKEKKFEEIRNFFETKIKMYNQTIEKCEFDVEKCIERYKKQMNKLITAYDNTFLKIFEMMQDAMNKQKIMISNMVTLKEKLDDEQTLEEDKEKIKKMIKASAQKKLNYSVIIDECNARLGWCIESFLADVDVVFENEACELQVYKENIIQKIWKKFSSMFWGKGEYKEFLENYKLNDMKKIKLKNTEKILALAITLNGVIKQIEEVERQMTEQYTQVVSAKI